jgi:hypothetical protein
LLIFSLPKLENTFRKHCKIVEQQLQQLPEHVPNALAQKILLDRSRNFRDDIKKYVASNPLIVRVHFERLIKQLLDTRAKFDISLKSGCESSAIIPPDIEKDPLDIGHITLLAGLFPRECANGHRQTHFAERYSDLD